MTRSNRQRRGRGAGDRMPPSRCLLNLVTGCRCWCAWRCACCGCGAITRSIRSTWPRRIGRCRSRPRPAGCGSCMTYRPRYTRSNETPNPSSASTPWRPAGPDRGGVYGVHLGFDDDLDRATHAVLELVIATLVLPALRLPRAWHSARRRARGASHLCLSCGIGPPCHAGQVPRVRPQVWRAVEWRRALHGACADDDRWILRGGVRYCLAACAGAVVSRGAPAPIGLAAPGVVSVGPAARSAAGPQEQGAVLALRLRPAG